MIVCDWAVGFPSPPHYLLTYPITSKKKKKKRENLLA
jgi:hypothetical protein